MEKMVTVECARCLSITHMTEKEIARRKKEGRSLFFCTIECYKSYQDQAKRCQPITKICPYCNSEFPSTTSLKSYMFCSRGCASAGSVTEKRHARAVEIGHRNHKYIPVELGMRAREDWKNAEVKAELTRRGVEHQFDMLIGFLHPTTTGSRMTKIQQGGSSWRFPNGAKTYSSRRRGPSGSSVPLYQSSGFLSIWGPISNRGQR